MHICYNCITTFITNSAFTGGVIITKHSYFLIPNLPSILLKNSLYLRKLAILSWKDSWPKSNAKLELSSGARLISNTPPKLLPPSNIFLYNREYWGLREVVVQSTIISCPQKIPKWEPWRLYGELQYFFSLLLLWALIWIWSRGLKSEYLDLEPRKYSR